jgi:hypothetical protein
LENNMDKLKAQRTAAEARPGSDEFKDYVHQAYPKWLYSPDGQSVVVHNDTERRAIVGKWYESPEDAKKVAAKLADEASKAAAEEAAARLAVDKKS